MKVLERRTVNLDEVKFAPYNPRSISIADFQKLKRSIEEYGHAGTLIINKRNDHVVGGNQTLKALKELGYTEAEAVFVDLDDDNEKALNIALNKISGEWDVPKLDELLDELKLNEFDITLTGYDLSDIKVIDELVDDDPGIPLDDYDMVEDVEGDFKHADVTVVIGYYRRVIPRDIWDKWEKEIQLTIGFHEDDVLDELLRRLGFDGY